VLRGDFFAWVAGFAARRPGRVILGVVVLAVAGALLATRLESSASTETLVDTGSESFEEAERFKAQFGDDAIVVLIEGDLQRTLLTEDLRKVFELEGCLSGSAAPERLKGLPPECAELARRKPVKVVYGPANLINRTSEEIKRALGARVAQRDADAEAAAAEAARLARDQGLPPARQRELAEAARQLVVKEFNEQLIQIALRYGLTRPPRPDDPGFVSQLVFDTAKGINVPKSRFAYLFPSPNAALIQIRLRADLSERERENAIALIKDATANEAFKLDNGQRYVVSGVPVVVAGLAAAVERSIFVLLGAALLVMAATLALVFRTRLRLLPLGLAMAAAALTYGAVSLAGGSLTMASIAALPVLIGLAVDYAIQFQARYSEIVRDGGGPPPREAARVAAITGAPTIGTAGLATAVGFLVLLLSPVPMVRGFGAIIVLGVALGFACALTAGFAALIRYGRAGREAEEIPPVAPRLRAAIQRGRARVAATPPGRAVRGATHAAGRVAGAIGRGALDGAIRQPRRVLAIGMVLAALGWVADSQTEVISDVRELVPQDLQALQDAETLERATGVTGEIDVTVRADDLTRPGVLEWMTKYQSEVLEANGFEPGAACGQPDDRPNLCPALSLTDLFRTTDTNDQASVRRLLDAVPPYFAGAVISEDRKFANLAFGIRLLPADRQQEVIEDMERRLEGAPEGVEASVTGLPVIFSEATTALSSTPRRALTLIAGLLAVFLVLLLVRRRTDSAAVPLIPIALATGWSALVLFVLGIPLNPMSATLGALVIAISTEFSVLLSARYEEERAGGAEPREALEATYRSTGAAVLASGATAIAGFAALMASDIRMLRDFGIVTVVDLTVSLLGVMVVLPAALMWAEQRGALSLSPRRVVRAIGRVPRLRAPRPSLRLTRLPGRRGLGRRGRA